REFPLGSDIDLYGLYNSRIDIVTSFHTLHFFVELHLQIVKLLLKGTDDFVYLVSNWRRIDLNPIVHGGEFTQQRLGDLSVGRDDNLPRLGVDDVERNLLTQQNVAEG